MAASANRGPYTCPVKCRSLILRKTRISNRNGSQVLRTHCREGTGSEVVGFVDGILAVVDVSGRVGINFVR
jgi:hypothetical protein